MSRSEPQPVGPARSPSLNSVGFLMNRAQMRLREGIVAALEGTGLQPGHLAVLGTLTDCGSMSQRALGELSHIEKSSMVLIIDSLERAGWVRRGRDPNDRRAHLVQMTEDGVRRFESLGQRLVEAQEGFLHALSQRERALLIDLLKQLVG